MLMQLKDTIILAGFRGMGVLLGGWVGGPLRPPRADSELLNSSSKISVQNSSLVRSENLSDVECSKQDMT